jgi:SulP family sulfate permease
VIKWVYKTWFQLEISEYLIIIASLIVIFSVGFLEGIAVGFAAELILFVYNYAQLDIIQEGFEGTQTKTESFRSPTNYLLRDKTNSIKLWQLQRYIFFGNANRLIEQFRELVPKEKQLPCYFVIDCSRLERVDASGVLSLSKILRLASRQKMTVVYTNLSPSLENQLQQGEALETDNPYCKQFPDLNQGLQWCENQLLEGVSLEQSASLS